MPDDRKYIRVYYDDLIRDYPDVWNDDGQLGPYVRLLATADPMWPTPPELPRSLRARAFDRLKSSGLLIALPMHRFTLKGLDAERSRRSDAGRNAAAKRWHSDGNADGNAKTMPNRDETSNDETSKEARAPSPRQAVHRWLSEHGAAAPVGWVNTTLNELVKVYGAEPIVTLWESAPKDIRTSKQFVQHAERSLTPGVHKPASNGGHTRSTEEVERAFNR